LFISAQQLFYLRVYSDTYTNKQYTFGQGQ